MDQILINEIKNFGSFPEWGKLTDKGFDKSGYEMAILRATRDLTPRTLTPIKRNDEIKPLNYLLSYPKNEIIAGYEGEKSFYDIIQEYFSNDPVDTKEDFDEWHDFVCTKIVLPVVQHFYTNRDAEHSPVCYGKAQKIVNITLKCCYCLDGARDREDYFTYCHVPLDSFTLNWYKKNGGQIDTEWSKLDEVEYEEIQKFIRNIEPDIELFNNLTPLQKEFLIWRLEIMKSTVKAVNSCLGGMIDESYATDYLEKHGMGNELKMAKFILRQTNLSDIVSDADFRNWLDKIPQNRKNKPTAEYIISLLQE